MIRTVTGDVKRLDGRILTHEHLQIDLSATKGDHVVIGPDEYAHVKADVAYVNQLGFGAIVDVTAPEVGRDPQALARISRETGVSIVCSTGCYWEPRSEWVAEAAVEDLAERMVEELTGDIDGAGIRAGVIKIGNSKSEADAVDARIFAAAARASMATGAPIITHTSHPEQVFWQIEALVRCGAEPGHVLIGHLDRADEDLLREAAKYGCFLGIDKISYTWQQTDERRAELVGFAVEQGFASQMILSSDMARRERLAYYGGQSYSFTWLNFVPLLRGRGVDNATIELMLRDNPNRLLRWQTGAAEGKTR